MTLMTFVTTPSPEALRYEQDFYSWALEQAELLRGRRWDELDIANVVEELESLARSEFRSLVSALRVLTLHLLKWDHQPERRSRSWALTIAVQRQELSAIMKDNPGLKPRVGEAVERAYQMARLEAAKETGLDEDVFPPACPYDLSVISTREIAHR
jgi:predicted DNA-binding ribbon-helix-helix protein